MQPPRTKRRLLTASVGIAAFTAVEGLACGNPVSPRYEQRPEPTPATEPALPPATDNSAAATATPTAAVATDPPAAPKP